MIPRLLEYDDQRVIITAEAFAIPEIKYFIDKYKDNAEPYIAYINAVSSPVSPYINLPVTEREESTIYDIKTTLGDFDYEDPGIEKAVSKLRSLYTSPNVLLAEELGQELHRIIHVLKTEELVMGEGGNFRERMSLLEKIEKISTSYRKVREEANKEIESVLTKGEHEVGEY